MPVDMALQYLSASRVRHDRSRRVGNRRRLIHYGRMTRVLKAPVFTVGWRHLRNDGVFESGMLERFLPVSYALNEIGNPLFWRGGIDKVYDRLGGFHQLPH